MTNGDGDWDFGEFQVSHQPGHDQGFKVVGFIRLLNDPLEYMHHKVVLKCEA